MAYRIEITEEAEREAIVAHDYIYQDSPRNAANWYAGLHKAIRSLDTFPLRCPLAPENDHLDEEVRHLIYGSYRIIFTVSADTVTILHVRHGARMPFKPWDKRT